jgi:hypothetical protein
MGSSGYLASLEFGPDDSVTLCLRKSVITGMYSSPLDDGAGERISRDVYRLLYLQLNSTSPGVL